VAEKSLFSSLSAHFSLFYFLQAISALLMLSNIWPNHLAADYFYQVINIMRDSSFTERITSDLTQGQLDILLNPITVFVGAPESMDV
jgi:hypothetical protein